MAFGIGLVVIGREVGNHGLQYHISCCLIRSLYFYARTFACIVWLIGINNNSHA
jgi:hypothetical protein